MLAAMADIVFLVDESNSIDAAGDSDAVSHVWLQGVVERMNDVSFVESLTSKGITDVRYGLVGFSDRDPLDIERFAHSQVVDGTNYNPSNPSTFTGSLFGDNIQLDTAIANLDDDGTDPEDGWDAIEHTIAEYDFRDGAVPIFVLMQNEEGRVPLNDTPRLNAPGPTISLATQWQSVQQSARDAQHPEQYLEHALVYRRQKVFLHQRDFCGFQCIE